MGTKLNESVDLEQELPGQGVQSMGNNHGKRLKQDQALFDRDGVGGKEMLPRIEQSISRNAKSVGDKTQVNLRRNMPLKIERLD